MSTARPRIPVLLCVESITLSQVVRLVVLARALDRRRYEVHFASGAFDPLCFAGADVVRHVLPTLPSARVLRRVGWGRRPYERDELRAYVESELALLRRLRPAAVVGDFRLSLAVSAAVAQVPYLALANVHWWTPLAEWPVPDHPAMRLLGRRLVARHFRALLPRVLAWFAAPLDAVRAGYGLPPLGDLRAMLTAGDRTLYADPSALAPRAELPPSHHCLGPVPWAPPVPLPPSMPAAMPGRPFVYVTLGSSGDTRVLGRVLRALAALPVRVLLATAGRPVPRRLPRDVHAAAYVPGDRAARLAALVVCNGGSSTAHQALAAGVPVLGLPSNLDQHLAMAAIAARGAGIALPAQEVSVAGIRRAAATLLADERHREAARALAMEMAKHDAGACFAAVLGEVVAGAQAAEPPAARGAR